jgi:hypothetical protein
MCYIVFSYYLSFFVGTYISEANFRLEVLIFGVPSAELFTMFRQDWVVVYFFTLDQWCGSVVRY